MYVLVSFLPSPVLYLSLLVASLLEGANVAVVRSVRQLRRLLRRRSAKGGSGIMVVILGLMISIFVGMILVNEFEDVIDDRRVGASAEYNATADDIIDNTWTVFTFLAIGIIIVGAAWILRQSGLLG